jgi:hypothetical protein
LAPASLSWAKLMRKLELRCSTLFSAGVSRVCGR